MTDDQLHREVARMARELADKDREIQQLKTERDEARRSICALDADIMEDQIEYAKHRGWDCFGKEQNA